MRLRSLWIALAAVFLLQPPAQAGEPTTGKRFGDVTESRVVGEFDSGENWLVNGGRFTGEHYSPLDQITDRNVKQLGLAWATDIPSPSGLVAEPIVVDGVIYLSAVRSVVYALDAATGKMLWQFDPEVRLDLSLPTAVHAEWQDIVLGGSRLVQGMPAFQDSGMSVEDSKAIHAYVVEQSWKHYEQSEKAALR